MSETTRLVTAEELERFPHDDRRYELVEGRVIRMSPVGLPHGRIVANVLVLLAQHVRANKLGVAVTELGCRLRSDPDTVRAPDVTFIRQGRLLSPEPKGFWNGPPDLAVEVLSPDDRPSEIRVKVEEYLAAGVSVVVVIDPDLKSITTIRPSSSPHTLRADDEVLDLDDVVSGFSCSVREVFE